MAASANHARQPDLLEAGDFPGDCQDCGMVTCQCERPAPSGADGPARPRDPAAVADWPPDLAMFARIYASASVGRMLSTRIDQALRHGHTPDKDAELQPFWLPREAHNRLIAALDDIGRDQGGPARSPDHLARRKQALRRIEVAGALLMAGHDVLARLIERDTHAARAEAGKEGVRP